MDKTPLDWVLEQYLFPAHRTTGVPWEFLPLQIPCINELALNWNAGYWLEMSCGKTACSTAAGLYHKISMGATVIVIMPPLLVPQWSKWLRSIINLQTGKPLSVTEYKGTPRQRAALNKDVDFLLIGYQIFKNDFTQLEEWYKGREYTIILDEATAVSNTSTLNHSMIYNFTTGRPRMLLSGTPANNPLDAYGLLRFTNPTAYRSYNQFVNLHVEETDFFGNPKKFRNLDRVYDALETNSKRILFREMHAAVDTPLFIPMEYELDPDHQKLYKKLAEEQLLALDDGGKLDASSANKLLHALGQIVINWGHFAQDPKLEANGLKLVDEVLHELGSQKLVIFASYKMTVATLAARYKAGYINSTATQKEKDAALELFANDPDERVLVINPKSGGYGLDGLQYVCNNALWLEPSTIPRDFAQANARLDRTGQTSRVVVRIATALKTNQVRQFKALLTNDELMNSVIRTSVDLRAAIFGE